MKKLFLLLFALFSPVFFQAGGLGVVIAQNQHLLDSLETKLKTLEAEKHELRQDVAGMNDTNAVKILNTLAHLCNNNSPDKGLEYAGRAMALSEQLGYKRGLSNAYTTMGGSNYLKANYLLSLEFHKKALKVRQEIGDKIGIAGSYHNIGLIYTELGKFPEALENIFAALKINEETGNKLWQSYNLLGIGSIYETQGNHTGALKNYFAALKLEKETGIKAGMSSTYISIGSVYQNQGNLAEALKNYLASLTIAQELGEKNIMGYIYDNIGEINILQRNFPEALKNLFAAIKFEEETGNKSGITSTYVNIGEVYRKEKNFNEAAVYFDKALALAKEIGSVEYVRNSYYELALLDSARGNYKQYIEDYKLYINYRDSLVNAENTKKTVALQMTYDFNKIQTADSLKNYQEKEISNLKLQKQKAITYGGFAGIAITIVLLFFVYRNYKKQQHANLQLKEAQEQLIKAEKMAAFGTVASRLSHEILNPLNFVNNFSVLSKDLVTEINTTYNEEDRKEASALLTDNLEKITEHGKRAVDIVKQLQEMSNKGTAQEFFEENKK